MLQRKEQKTMNPILEPYLHNQPHWLQIGTQAFMYGFLCWLEECIESYVEIPSVQDLLTIADPEFEHWMSEYYQELSLSLLAYLKDEPKQMTRERFDDLYTQVEETIRQFVPIDLIIFTFLSDGESITDEQWERLMDTMAFSPLPLRKDRKDKKTRRIHGRRAITPMRRQKGHRATTFHRRSPPLLLTIDKQS